MTQDLKDKAIKIQGKNYVLVSDRVIFFNENYKDGVIKTELISDLKDTHIVIKATVIPDANKPKRIFTGYSQAVIGQGYINKTAALENCETSAVGRALAFMGIGVLDSIASADEVRKATNTEQRPYSNPVVKSVASKYPPKTEGEKCPNCNGIYIKGKTGNIYCENKCWLPENAYLKINKDDPANGYVEEYPEQNYF
jgi:hypothetical protein